MCWERAPEEKRSGSFSSTDNQEPERELEGFVSAAYYHSSSPSESDFLSSLVAGGHPGQGVPRD